MAAQLLCVGFSARAAASSARRAGFQPLAADHFADRDLAASQVRRIARYPADLLQAVADLPAVPLVYGGALENYPEIVERLQKERIVWGNDAATLRRVRDPFQLAAVLQAVGQPLPPLTTCPDQLPRDGSWLSKNGRGSGGGHVRGWYGQSGPGQPCGYFQQRQEGIPCSAVFVGAAGQAQLLGTTRQLIGLPGADTDSF
ncbi:MAG: ATP-dependent carboligase, partial [Planctomycetales bacterium]|nr:ATP-dependent carboligase [Planctomycetales bacterium]